MSGRERRVIHMALRGEGDVRTESEGFGLNRQVVIHPRTAAPKPAQPFGRRR
jgi:predicted RNA-binding protein Jag